MTLEWNSPDYRDVEWFFLLRTKPRDLTRSEFGAVMPPRGPSGSVQNRARGSRVRMLNNRGFTVEGKRVR